ncbi:hypothetical protein [Natrialba sp. INN-245]|uniref:hypothetical protein n=1 Tax=Natrialba sp. INN-245 TaxID=2690967 RepID=UPI00130FB811|nr:hypothetical protein [Natrialba sp. INN-245]MWV41416.1 hypothetical protein [Natrialba sp. INN-245]
MPIFPPERRPTVDIVTLGDVSGTTISTARQTLEGTFGIVARRRRGPDPDRVFDSEPSPHTDDDLFESEALLDAIDDASEADLAIGLTAVGIRHERQERLFGLGLVGGPCAIISTYCFEESENLFAERIEKQVRKQMGRLLGLDTTHGGCVLERASFLGALDETDSEFCSECRARLTNPETAPAPPLWIVGDSPVLAENFDADVEESNDASAAGSRTDDSGLELSLRTLPLVPIGFVAMALSPFARGVSRFAAWESTLPPETRRVLHGGYRIVRFWTFAALFVLLAVLTLYAELSLYARVLGTSPGAAIVWGMIVVAIGLGFYGQLLVRSMVAGAYEGLLRGSQSPETRRR